MMPFLILFSMLQIQSMQVISPSSENISYMGRFHKQSTKEYVCSFPASTMKIRTDANEVNVLLQDYPLDVHHNYVSIIVDGVVIKEFQLNKDSVEYKIFSSTDNIMHTIEVCKKTEGLVGNIGFLGFKVNDKAKFEKIEEIQKKILFIGNSITCGYGCEGTNPNEPFTAETENAYMSYAAIAARHFKSQYHLIAFSGKGIYRNWADTVFDKETMPIIFERTLVFDTTKKWKHADYTPKLIVLNLGTNDFSPPLGADKELFVSRYIDFLKKLVSIYPTANIVCVNSQMLSEPFRSSQIEWIQEAIAKVAVKQIYFCKFSEQGPQGYGADFHPNIAQNFVNAKELVGFILELALLK